MANTTRRKRFIAGAVCPKCQAKDTLVLYMENNVEKMHCVACGYQRSQVEQAVAQKANNETGIIGVFKPN